MSALVDYNINPGVAMDESHDIPAIADLATTARHEAGHLLMQWSMDSDVNACGG
jgi:hypothetical protein